ncbi:MAG: hypothetical protein KAR32_11045 [Candidatus Omnitrophica bacterium]|nr:hypothetical protein [Candidatus Omnitrophota bacterium]
MNHKKNIPYFSAAIVLILLNIGIFFYANSFPLRWAHNEILYHYFVWAADGINDLTTLKSGLRFSDFAKPFMSTYVDGAFRTRHVSYLFEMLSFKFWQFFDKGFIRNYTLIGLHILNTVLSGILVAILTKKKWIAWISSLFLLNSGIALATLLFPFRNAKLLVMTFILLAWIIVARSSGKFCDAKASRIWLFFILLFLACFTDEAAFFLCPIIFIYIYFRDDAGGLFSRRLLGPAVITGLVFICCAVQFLAIATRHIHGDHMIAFQHIIRTWGSCYANGLFVRDLLRSFFMFFLRRNFGYWDLTLPGMLAAVSFLLLIFHLARHSSTKYRRMCLAIGIVLLIKAVILVHNGGYHKFIMPETTVLPSLFFFSYYYVYAEAVLLSIIIGLLMDVKAINDKKVVFYLCLAGFIGLSNTLHLKKGPKDALMFHGWDQEHRVSMVDNIIALQKVIKNEQYQPLYLSFPCINEPLLRGKIMEQSVPYYVKPILVMFLKEIEEGRTIVSLENIKPEKPFPSGEELRNADYFYDVIKKDTIDLRAVREEKGLDSLKSFRVRRGVPQVKLRFDLKSDDRHFLFFVKGKARIDIGLGQRPPVQVFQVFGYSYQVFRADINVPGEGGPHQMSIVITPKDVNQEVSVVGPLFFPERRVSHRAKISQNSKFQ